MTIVPKYSNDKLNRKSKFKDYYESYCMNFMNYKMM